MDYQIKSLLPGPSTLNIMGLKYGFTWLPEEPTANYLMFLETQPTAMRTMIHIYEQLYDITQTHDDIRIGDTFTIEVMEWTNSSGEKFQLPEQRFELNSPHLEYKHFLEGNP